MTPEPPPHPVPNGLLAWWKRLTTPTKLMVVHPDRLAEVRLMVAEYGMGNDVTVRGNRIVPAGQAMIFDLDALPDWLAEEIRAEDEQRKRSES